MGTIDEALHRRGQPVRSGTSVYPEVVRMDDVGIDNAGCQGTEMPMAAGRPGT